MPIQESQPTVARAGYPADASLQVTSPRTPEITEPTMTVSPWQYLRTMALIAWHSFRHPLTTTVIDMQSGACVQE